MEKIGSGLSISEAKQLNLKKAYDEASSLVRLHLEWKELEAQFDTTRNELRRRFREIQTREDQVDRREKSLETAKCNFDAEMAGRVAELHRVEKLVEAGNNRLNSLKLLTKEHNDELDVKEKRFSEVGKLIREMDEERRKKLNSVSVKKVLEKLNDDVMEKESVLNWISGLIEEKTKVYDAVEEQIEAANRLIVECDCKVKLGEEKLGLIENSIKEREEYMKLREERLSNSIRECEEVLKSKEERLSLVQKSLVECSGTLESRHTREMGLKVKGVRTRGLGERFGREKERELCSIEMGIEERTRTLNLVAKSVEEKEKQLEILQESAKKLGQKVELTDREIIVKLRHIENQEKDIYENGVRIKEAERVIEEFNKTIESANKRELYLKEKESSLEQLSHDHEQVEYHLKMEGMKLLDKEKELEKKERQLMAKEKQLILMQKGFVSIREKESSLEQLSRDHEEVEYHLKMMSERQDGRHGTFGQGERAGKERERACGKRETA